MGQLEGLRFLYLTRVEVIFFVVNTNICRKGVFDYGIFATMLQMIAIIVYELYLRFLPCHYLGCTLNYNPLPLEDIKLEGFCNLYGNV